MLGTWLLVVVPAIAVYISTAAAPELGSASWLEAAQIGTGTWLAAHGAHLEVGEVTFTLIPLGVSVLALALTSAAIRRAALDTWSGPAFAIATYLAGTLLLSQVAGVPGAYRAAGGALIISVAAVMWGMRKNYPRISARAQEPITNLRARIDAWMGSPPDPIREVFAQVGTAFKAGTSTALRVLAGIFTLAIVGTVVKVVIAMPLILAVHDRLETDLVSTIVLTGGQILMAPTVIIWAAAYLSGAGFAVGEGTLYSPTEVLNAPLPALPLLGALPNPESAHIPAVGYVYLLVGGLAGWYLHRRLVRLQPGELRVTTALGGMLVATAITAVVVLILATLATGGFGPGRFAEGVGPRTAEFIGAVVWKTALPMAVVVTAANPATHRLLSRGWVRLRELISTRGKAA